jgi:hypothetical protein
MALSTPALMFDKPTSVSFALNGIRPQRVSLLINAAYFGY